MVAIVADDIVILAYKLTYNTTIYRKARGKTESLVLTYEFGQFLLKLYVDVKCAVQKTTACTTTAILLHSSTTCVDDALVTRKSGVGITAKHQYALAAHHYFCALFAFDFAEIRIYTLSHKLLWQSIFSEFFL